MFVCMAICLSSCLFMQQDVCLYSYLSVTISLYSEAYLSGCLYVCQSVFLFSRLFVFSVYLNVNVSLNEPGCLFVYLCLSRVQDVCLSNFLSVRMSFCAAECLLFSLFVCLYVLYSAGCLFIYLPVCKQNLWTSSVGFLLSLACGVNCPTMRDDQLNLS